MSLSSAEANASGLNDDNVICNGRIGKQPDRASNSLRNGRYTHDIRISHDENSGERLSRKMERAAETDIACNDRVFVGSSVRRNFSVRRPKSPTSRT
jgi:hypothetical protein